MPLTTATSLPLQVLQIAEPFAIIIYFLTATLISACFLQTPSEQKSWRRPVAVALLLIIILTLIAQATTYVVRALSQPGWFAPQSAVVYVMFSILAHGAIAISLFEAAKPVWHPFVGAWTLAILFELPSAALMAATADPDNAFERIECGVILLRAIVLTTLSLSQIWFTLSARSRRPGEDSLTSETAPLLGSSSVSPSGPSSKAANDSSDDEDNDDYYDGGFDDDDFEEEEGDKELRKLQKERLQQSGNWFSYVKDFKIFLPMLWPSGNLKIQLCLCTVGVVMLVERFLTVLEPRQLGILTDELTAAAGSGVMPWHTLVIWAVFVWLNSKAGTCNITRFVELPVEQFAYKAIGAAGFRHVMTLSMDFHNEKNSGELLTAIEQGQNLQGLIDFVGFSVLPTILDLFVAFGYVYSLFDVYMVAILLFVGIAYSWLGVRITAWSVKPRRRFNEAIRAESKVFNEAISNWGTVSQFNRGEYECKRAEQCIEEVNNGEWTWYVSMYGGYAVQALIMVLGRLAAAFLAAYRVSQGTARVGQFITLMVYWASVEGPLSAMSFHIRNVSRMLTDSERLLQLLTTKPTVVDRPEASELLLKAGGVEFCNVSFAYDARKPTIKDLSFVAEPGMTVAFVGETGGGKSTLLKLLYRYYDITQGSIKIDGQDIRSVTLDSLRESFGMVPQDPSLFNISVLDNIRYARLDASDEDVKNACRAAAIHDKIESFPDGYQSKVGERGVKLSGGEMQRVAIARAILRQPKIVLLDEATSMIDAETEALIQQALKRLTAGRTTFVVAHRLSTIQHADLILVVQDGQIVERGTHQELYRLNGKYTALWSRQLSKDVGQTGQVLDVSTSDDDLVGTSD